MRDFILVTDGACDLPPEMVEKLGVCMMPLAVNIGDIEFMSDDTTVDIHDFYMRMRNGDITSTSQLTPITAATTFEDILKEGKDVLYVAFSSALTSGLNNAVIAANELKGKYPDAKIEFVDSLCASGGFGLLVYLVANFKNSGKTLSETVEYAEKIKAEIVQDFTVEDLVYLSRGGRLSKGAAFMGNLLNVKPVLHVDDEGRLVPVYKVKGRKKSIEALANEIEKKSGNYKNDIVFINHADSPEDAQILLNIIKEHMGIDNFLVWNIGPVIGAHSGPGTIALFYLGETR